MERVEFKINEYLTLILENGRTFMCTSKTLKLNKYWISSYNCYNLLKIIFSKKNLRISFLNLFKEKIDNAQYNTVVNLMEGENHEI